jgi:hypothetical protein
MQTLFTDPNNHFVDRAMKGFQEQMDIAISDILEEHFAGIDKHLLGYAERLRKLAPVSYPVTIAGTNIRAELDALLPRLDQLAIDLRQWVPTVEDQTSDDVETAFQGPSTNDPDIGSFF